MPWFSKQPDLKNNSLYLEPRVGAVESSVAQSVKYVNVMKFGALNNDTNPTVTTQAFKDAILSASDEDTIYIPNGTFAINDTITINKRVHFICDGKVKFYGTRDRAAFHFVRPVGRKIEFNGEIVDQITTWHGWTSESYVGIIFENAFRCNIKVTAVRNFTVGVRCLASNGLNYGFFFNTLNILQLNDNKIQLEIYQKDTSSWFNSNIFNDMFFSYSQGGVEFQTATVDRYCIKQTLENNTYDSDSNIFHNIRFDIGNPFGGTYTGIFLKHAWGWKFNNYRVEFVAGTNVKFCTLDLSADSVYGLEFNPAFETFTSQDNVKINLINTNQNMRSSQEVYKKTGVQDNTRLSLLYKDKRWNERYRRSNADAGWIDNVYRFISNVTTLDTNGEKVADYQMGDILIENGVNIDTYYTGVLYLRNLKAGDTFNIKLLTATVPGTPSISLKAWDTSDVFIDNNEINVSGTLYKAISSGGVYWDNTGKKLAQNVTGNELSFTVNRNEAKTIAILFSGGLNGIEIFSSRADVSVLKSIVTIRNNVPHQVQTTAPTYKTEGKFLAGDIVYNPNTAVGQDIAWQLIDTSWGAGTLAWKSLGKY